MIHKPLLMLALFVTLFLGASTLQAAYDVKIGVYKNAKNLRANIAKIKSTKYKKSIRIEKKGALYYAHAVVPSALEARNALRAYKKIFADSFISEEQVKVRPLKRTKPLVTLSSQNIKKKNQRKISSDINATALLQNKTIYLCYDKSPKHLKGRVVKMNFGDKNIVYTPLENNNSINIDYVFKDDKVVLNLLDMNVTHKIDSVNNQFLKASNSIKDVIVYTLRYYFSKENALSFIKSKNSKK